MNNLNDSKTKYYTWLEFEHKLINNRMTWLLSSQSLLFAAFALAATESKDDLRFLLNAIAVVGALVSIIILVGIIASYLGKFKARNLYEQETHEKIPVGVNTSITVTAMLSEMSLALVFTGAWIYIFRSY